VKICVICVIRVLYKRGNNNEEITNNTDNVDSAYEQQSALGRARGNGHSEENG
jgi:hypothetical protein